MSWVRLDDRFAESPKVVDLSDQAFRCYVETLCYVARNLTDGAIPRAIVERYGTAIADELTRSGLWDKGPTIHDYLEYNPQRAEVLAQSREKHDAKVRAGRKGAQVRWGKQTDSTAVANGKQQHSPLPLPLPQPLPEPLPLPQEQEPLNLVRVAAHSFAEFWREYPRRDKKLGAEAKFKAAVKRGVDPGVIIAGASRYRDDPNRDPRYTMLPTTWLNNGCWDDGPLPARGSSAKGVGNILDLAERAREEGI
jgi:hypothetical protein